MATVEGDPAVARALDLLAPPAGPDLNAAWQRHQAQAGPAPAQAQPYRLRLLTSLPLRVPATALAAALVVALMVATPMRGIAAQFLTIFRVQDVTPIRVDSMTQPMPDLSRFGDVSPSPREFRLQPAQVASVAAASSQAGFTVQTPRQLPSGLSNPPSVVAVSNGATINFTFRVQKARAYLDSSGHKDVAVPARFDGATLSLRVPTAVSLAYLPAGASLADLQAPAGSDKAGGKPDTSAANRLLNGSGLLLMQARSPELDATGVSADELREFMLSMPGIPEDTRVQLQAIGDWRNTLPVPAPPGSNLHKVSVNGAPGVAGQNGSTRVLMWVKNGQVYALAGPKLEEKDLLAVASSVG